MEMSLNLKTVLARPGNVMEINNILYIRYALEGSLSSYLYIILKLSTVTILQ